MSRKKLDPPFEDTVLPVFDQPEPEPERVKSKKEQDDDLNKIVYRRHKGAKRILCDPCIGEHRTGQRPGINDGSYLRTHAGNQTALCFFHKQEAEHRDKLNAPRQS